MGMTIEEAIRELKAMYEHILPYMSIMGTEAYDMAIKTLEQQLSGDCISREQAIEKSKPEFLNDNVVRETEKETIANQNYNKGWNDCNHEWIDILSKLPSVTPQPFINKPCVSEGVCREDKIQVLDTIRAELIQSIQNGTLKIESGNEELFSIIDKYKKTGSEGGK